MASEGLSHCLSACPFSLQIGMWGAMEELLNDGQPADTGQSFFVGDLPTDREWADNVGKAKRATMGFETPPVAFGPAAGPCWSNKEGSGGAQSAANLSLMGSAVSGAGGLGGLGSVGGAAAGAPAEALAARRALLGGYLRGARMLVLCGPQGSGKSFFCAQLLGTDGEGEGGGGAYGQESGGWVHVSQDTAPGRKREAVEKAARVALENGRCVVVDRMHVTAEQRAYFISIAQQLRVPVDAVVLSPPLDELQRRVAGRQNHPTGFQGGGLAAQVASSYRSLQGQPPSYAEGFGLITAAHSPEEVAMLVGLYRKVQLTQQVHPEFKQEVNLDGTSASSVSTSPTPRPLPPPPLASLPLVGQKGATVRRLPTIVLGTMELKELAIVPALGAGFAGLDTAPTYKNEQAVGRAMQQVAARGRPVARAVVGGGEGSTGVAEGSIGFDERPYLIVKVPGRCKYAPEVRVELMASLAKLGRPKCDLLLLHWPHAVIEAGTLGEVWGAMEAAVHEGLVDSLGVCNFTARALATLLDEPLCTIPPAVNQIERHPLLPQWELLEACRQRRIIVQAHTPLGHGASRLLAHPVVTAIAAQCGLSAAQVLLQWSLRHGLAIAPKCSSHAHAAEVLAAAPPMSAPLSPEQMAALDAMTPPGQIGTRTVGPPFMTTQAGPQRHVYGF